MSVFCVGRKNSIFMVWCSLPTVLVRVVCGIGKLIAVCLAFFFAEPQWEIEGWAWPERETKNIEDKLLQSRSFKATSAHSIITQPTVLLLLRKRNEGKFFLRGKLLGREVRTLRHFVYSHECRGPLSLKVLLLILFFCFLN